jgi:hypothetical protein
MISYSFSTFYAKTVMLTYSLITFEEKYKVRMECS